MIETIIKIVGSIVEPVIGRLGRGRPQAEVIAKPILGVRPYEYIHIQNLGSGSVLIQGVQARPPGIYGVARDHSPGAITRAQVNIDTKVLLRPGETCDLPIVPLRDPTNVPKDEKPLPVRFVIYWRKTSSSRLPQIPVMIRTSTQDIKDIAAAAASQRPLPTGRT
jgi:hypothetical protein